MKKLIQGNVGKHKCIFIILDGWGIAENKEKSAICNAKTDFIDYISAKYNFFKIKASGEFVGLPPGQMGNSEVGHLTIGAGRVVKQQLPYINEKILNGEFFTNKRLLSPLYRLKIRGGSLHLIGLVSDGGIHSHLNHVNAILLLAKKIGFNENVFLHAITDGRDTKVCQALEFLRKIDQHMINTVGKIVTVSGRYYAMDRDSKLDRTALAYQSISNMEAKVFNSYIDGVKYYYSKGIFDEFIPPFRVDVSKNSTINNGDLCLFFNFRADRMIQLFNFICSGDLFKIPSKRIEYLTMSQYSEDQSVDTVIYPKQIIKNSISEVISTFGKVQIKIAETEKYPHITYFFSGGRETPFVGESRILCPSPNVLTYDQCPEMSAGKIVKSCLQVIKAQNADFICVNFANTDMVGHTGNMLATIQACQYVDVAVMKLVTAAYAAGYHCVITADHGNADIMINEDYSICTTHTVSDVPLIIIPQKTYDKAYIKNMNPLSLSDIAPVLLSLLDLNIPAEML